MIDIEFSNRNKHVEDLYLSIIEGMKLYSDNKEYIEAMASDDETKIDLKFGNDPMVDKQYREDLFGNNDAKLEIETDDDMLEALARFYSNYQTGNETRDEVAARMSSWLLELQELRAMKRNLNDFINDFTRLRKDTRALAKPMFGNGNSEAASYAQGKLAALNVVDSYLDTRRLNYYNREEQ